MFGRKSKAETEAATAVLEAYRRIEAAIEMDVANLPVLELVEAERELQNAEVGELFGEQPAAHAAKAQKRVAGARAAIDNAARRLQGLRGRLLTAVAAMPGPHDALMRKLPEHNQAIKTAFEVEWRTACESFGKILGRRAAIEQALGEVMNLPEPSPITAEIEPEIVRPHQQLAELKRCIEKAAEAETRVPSRGAAEIDRYWVHVLKQDCRGLPAGTLVIRDTFPDGVLAWLVQIKLAQPWTDPQESAARNTARAAKLALDDAERARQAERIEADAKQRAAERKAYNKAHGIEEYDGPTGGACVPRVSMPGNPVVRSSYMAEYLSDK